MDQEKDPVKIFLTDYVIMDSKLEKETVAVQVTNSDGKPEEIVRQQPGKVLAIRFKKIIKTFVTTNARGEEEETYIFEKKRDAGGEPTEQDAEFYTFSGSRIMIDQAQRDFSPEDLPAPTIIQQFRGKDNKLYTKFT